MDLSRIPPCRLERERRTQVRCEIHARHVSSRGSWSLHLLVLRDRSWVGSNRESRTHVCDPVTDPSPTDRPQSTGQPFPFDWAFVSGLNRDGLQSRWWISQERLQSRVRDDQVANMGNLFCCARDPRREAPKQDAAKKKAVRLETALRPNTCARDPADPEWTHVRAFARTDGSVSNVSQQTTGWCAGCREKRTQRSSNHVRI